MNFGINKYIILVILLLLFGGLYFGINNYSEKSRVLVDDYGYNFSKIIGKNIKTEKYAISNSKYVYTGTGEFIFDSEKVNKLIGEIKSINIKSIASNNKENFEKFGISESGSVVNIDGKKILLGKIKGYYGEEYIAIDGMDKVFVINKNLKSILNKDQSYFKKVKTEEAGTGKIMTDTKVTTGTGIVK